MVHGADQGRQRRCGPRVTLTCACRAAPYPARKVDNISQTMTFGIPHEGLCVVQGFFTKTPLAVRTIFKKISWKH